MPSQCTKELGAFISGLTYGDLPQDVIDKAKTLILDSLGNQIAGTDEESCRQIVTWVRSLGANGQATVVGRNFKAPAAFAAFCNGTMAHAIEMDDAHRDGLVKAGSVLVPTAIAVGESQIAQGRKTIAGLVAGYEVMIRLGLALNPGHRHRNFHSTGSLGAFGAAAVTSVIMGANANEATSALGTAGTQAAGLAAFLEDPECMSKSFNAGKGAFNGVLAGELAANGFIGPRKVIEGKEGFARAVSDEIDFDVITAGLGSEWRIREVGYKPHAACRYAHGPIDTAYALFEKHGTKPAEVESVVVRASTLATRQSGHNDPATLHSAQGSTPFSVALSLLLGQPYLRLQDFVDAWDSAGQPVCDLSRRIVMESDEARFGFMGRGCEVELKMTDGQLLRAELDLPKGEPENPLTVEELNEKFLALAVPIVGLNVAMELAGRVGELDSLADLQSIASLLSPGAWKTSETVRKTA